MFKRRYIHGVKVTEFGTCPESKYLYWIVLDDCYLVFLWSSDVFNLKVGEIMTLSYKEAKRKPDYIYLHDAKCHFRDYGRGSSSVYDLERYQSFLFGQANSITRLLNKLKKV